MDVSAKWNKYDEEWYTKNQTILKSNSSWYWSFSYNNSTQKSFTQNMGNVNIGYTNMGFLLHKDSNNKRAGKIYAGEDINKNSIYSSYTSWKSVRVYVKMINGHYKDSNVTFVQVLASWMDHIFQMAYDDVIGYQSTNELDRYIFAILDD